MDADPRVSGRGFDFLRQKGIDVVGRSGRERALRLNRAYFTFKTKSRPFVIMKAATSLDNRVAAGPGQRTQISSDDSLRHAHAVRAEVDAIAVGSETVLVDDPLLTVRGIHRRRPLTRVLFDRRLRIPPSAQGVLDARGRTGDNRHDARKHRRPTPGVPGAWSGSGAELEPISGGTLSDAFARLGERQIDVDGSRGRRRAAGGRVAGRAG